ncbi:small acidic protein family-domain-containing protein [Dactylonectria estremocensis]|uniref:Small acidic protein n=1 Tax=Dactylonectria estremocensis TaxID=1079267 RepID=A0A9P9F3J0_9HYPO|nr:small acidic protein family-domain-containing protein [Dactylonectria estremocensis]
MSPTTDPDNEKNPVQLKVQRDAAVKKKLNTKQLKTEERAKKRNAKAEAKRTRKFGAKNVGKLADEHKPKKLEVPNRPAKLEKRKERLLQRSQKLEEKAKKLLADAKKAADQYQQLIDAETKYKQSVEANSDSDSSEDDSNSDASNAVASVDESDGESQSDNGVALTKPTMDEVPADVPADEVLLKQRRLSNAASERSNASHVESRPKIDLKKFKKSKKAEADEQEEKEASEADPEIESSDKKAKKAKKAEKKRKRANEAAKAAVTEEPAVKKDKSKDKSTKKPKRTEKAEEDAGAAEAEKWQVEDLDGGEARQAKFLRLLGGKKAGAAVAPASKSKSDSTKAEAEIQRQFEAGMKMKNEGGSKRRGLGA